MRAKHERQRAGVGIPEQIAVAHLVVHDLRDLVHRLVVGADVRAAEVARRLDDDQAQAAVGAHGVAELAVEHEPERRRRQELRVAAVEEVPGFMAWAPCRDRRP